MFVQKICLDKPPFLLSRCCLAPPDEVNSLYFNNTWSPIIITRLALDTYTLTTLTVVNFSFSCFPSTSIHEQCDVIIQLMHCDYHQRDLYCQLRMAKKMGIMKSQGNWAWRLHLESPILIIYDEDDAACDCDCLPEQCWVPVRPRGCQRSPRDLGSFSQLSTEVTKLQLLLNSSFTCKWPSPQQCSVLWTRGRKAMLTATSHFAVQLPCSLWRGKCKRIPLPSQMIAIPTMQIVPSSREFRIQLMSLEED